ncbi:hypothetical protein B0H13DRAFT_2348579 [Mycena leptocephala]|nr:hypothetical protein B0H13DRAFT_2348579 [Mycena leptocephala]
MSERNVIIILGSRNPGKNLADAARRTSMDVVDVYSVKHRTSFTSQQPAVLLEIGKIVKAQLKNIRSGASVNITAIVFVHGKDLDKSTCFPFTHESSFLGLDDDALFRKLVVVQAAPENRLKLGWSHLLNAGMRVLSGDGKPDELLCQILASQAPLSNVPASSDASPNPLAQDGNVDVDDQPNLQQRYKDWARATGRHYDQAVILLVGHSGHGKSKTINRLIGHNLLEVVQRVKMPVPASNTEPSVILALDDTPGYSDNTHTDRGSNLAIIKLYQDRYFSENVRMPWRRYPNVILLVTSWNIITADAHNLPEHFTSPIGQSMFKLSQAELVDHDRRNVIVVVTKCMSFMTDFDDYKALPEKNEQWNIEAGKRRRIITDLQRKVFPKSLPWPIVSSRTAAASTYINPTHAAERVSLSWGLRRSGSGKDPALRQHFTQAEDVQEEKASIAIRLHCDGDVPNLARLSAHYSTSDSIEYARNSDSQMYVAQHLMEEVAVQTLCPELSEEMIKEISKLPPWSDQSRAQYDDFFNCYGTHVVLRLAVGGNIRIAVKGVRVVDERNSTRDLGVDATLPALKQFDINVGAGGQRDKEQTAGESRRLRDVRIFVDGGGAVAHQCSWPDAEIRTKWIKALDFDPAFCPDHISTEFRWLHTLGGLKGDQQRDLRDASEVYIKTLRHEKKVEAPQSNPRGINSVKDLPRKSNYEKTRLLSSAGFVLAAVPPRVSRAPLRDANTSATALAPAMRNANIICRTVQNANALLPPCASSPLSCRAVASA